MPHRHSPSHALPVTPPSRCSRGPEWLASPADLFDATRLYPTNESHFSRPLDPRLPAKSSLPALTTGPHFIQYLETHPSPPSHTTPIPVSTPSFILLQLSISNKALTMCFQKTKSFSCGHRHMTTEYCPRPPWPYRHFAHTTQVSFPSSNIWETTLRERRLAMEHPEHVKVRKLEYPYKCPSCQSG
jgi:hypothetical protein